MSTRGSGNGRKGGLAEAVPHYHGHRERLRARFREAGSEAVTDYELLELVLFRALPRRDVKPLAKALIAKFGSFAEVIAAPPPRLSEVPGLGEAAITEIKVVQAAANRLDEQHFTLRRLGVDNAAHIEVNARRQRADDGR